MAALIACTIIGAIVLVGAWIGVLHWCGFFEQHDDDEDA